MIQHARWHISCDRVFRMRSDVKRQVVIVRTRDGSPASKASSPLLAFGVQDLGRELDRSRLHAFLGSFGGIE